MKHLSDLFRPLHRVALAAGIASMVGLAAPAMIAHAQDGNAASGECAHRGPRAHRGHRGGGMRAMAQLNLTEAQRAQIRAIRQEARAEGRAPGARAAIRARIEAVLTPEQRQQAAELRQQHAQQRIERRVRHMSERLSLSAQQGQQLRGILRNAAMQRRVLHQQASDDPASARQAMRALHERTQAAVRSILSAEQAERLDALRAERGERGERRGRRGHGRRGHGGGPGHGQGQGRAL